MVSETKAVYRIRNWSEYNAGLVRRGDISLWINPEVLAQWDEGERTGRAGRPFTYGALVIETMFTLRCLYRLPLRATQGLMESLLSLLGVDLKVPSFATLSRRQGRLSIDLGRRAPNEPVHVLIDSTGLKVFGEGEWKVRQHGPGKRREWRKVHLAVDAKTRQIVACALTESAVGDPEVLPKLLLSIDSEIEKLGADGAYDTWQCRLSAHLHSPDVEVLIPPRANAVEDPNAKAAFALERNRAVGEIAQTGIKEWKSQNGYHVRSLVETFMFRFKRSFGPDLLAREIPNQVAETLLKSKILNRFIEQGAPQSEKVIP